MVDCLREECHEGSTLCQTMAARVGSALDDDGINKWGSASVLRGEFGGEVDFEDGPGLVE